MSALGKTGERLAAQALIARGYVILAQNWRCAIGEVDLIAVQGGELVIIEVKTRRGSAALDRALEALTPTKQARLLQLAAAYQETNPETTWAGVRIDVVAVAMTPEGTRVEVVANAVGW